MDLWHLQAEKKCPYPVAFLTDRSIGDMVLAMGALQIVAQKFEQMIVTTNIPQLLVPMAPPNANYHLGWLPYHAQAEIFNISVGSSMNPRYGHPIKQILDHLGVEAPCAIPQPQWRERTTLVTINRDRKPGEDYYNVTPIVYPEYDFLIHLNTDDSDRLWPFEQWAELIVALRAEYPDCSIGIIGSDQTPPWNHHKPDPRPFSEEPYALTHPESGYPYIPREAATDGSQPEPGVEYVYNRSFELVASLVKRARKAVITIDSAVSRIAHAVQSRNHVLLAPAYYPLEWAAHPLCYPVYGYPDHKTNLTNRRTDAPVWTVEDVLSAVRHANTSTIDDLVVGGQGLSRFQFRMPKARRVDAQALWQLRLLCGRWSEWPREGTATVAFDGGFGAIGAEVDLTRLTEVQAMELAMLMQRTGLFDSIRLASAVG